MRPRWRSTVSSARPVLSERMHAPAFRSGSVNQWRPLMPSLPCRPHVLSQAPCVLHTMQQLLHNIYISLVAGP